MADEITSDSQPSKPLQFRLSTIFVLTLVATLLAAFLSPRGNDLMLAGLISVVGTAMVALVVGYARPPMGSRIFWGIVIAAMMQAVCAETTLLDRSGIFAWPLAAGIAAVFAAGLGNRYRRMVLAAAIAGTIIIGYVLTLGAAPAVIIPYLACAAIGAALMTLLIDAVNWLEKNHRIPQPAIGLFLVLSAIGFAVFATRLIPGW